MPEKIQEIFSPDFFGYNNITLDGKPKLFFIDSYKGYSNSNWTPLDEKIILIPNNKKIETISGDKVMLLQINEF